MNDLPKFRLLAEGSRWCDLTSCENKHNGKPIMKPWGVLLVCDDHYEEEADDAH